MAQSPCIVVAGLGRCGSSLTMQMLHAGGVACLGDFPDFEDERASRLNFDPQWFADLSDGAIKLLDAHLLPLGVMPHHLIVWLERDPMEQARSMLKFVHAAVPGARTDRQARRAMVRLIERDGPRAKSALCSRGAPSLTLRFERLIVDPRGSAQRLGAFLAPFGYGANVVAMAAAVRPRSSRCLEGFLETELVA